MEKYLFRVKIPNYLGSEITNEENVLVTAMNLKLAEETFLVFYHEVNYKIAEILEIDKYIG